MQSADRLRTLAATHPRLHITDSELPELRQRAQRSHARYARHLFDWVDAHRDWEPRTTYPFENGRTAEVELEEAGIFVTNAALAAALSGEARYREMAMRWVLKMCEVPPEEPNNYGFGQYIAGIARAYDWLYDSFDPRSRERIRDHVARITRSLYLASFQDNPGRQWWAGSYLHHDFWIPTGGYGEAALAVVGEVDDAGDWALRAMQEFDTAFLWLGDDGAWQEGPADWCYALAPLLSFFGAWQSATGEDPHNIPWLRNTSLYRLYHWLPDNSYIYTDDSFRSGRYNTSGSASCHLLRRLASVFRDGFAQWLAERDEEFDLKPGPKGVTQAAYEGSSIVNSWIEYPNPQAFCAPWNLLWFDPSVETVAPTGLASSRHFENQGVSVLRSGWDANATVASFSCGPLAGHRAQEAVVSGDDRLRETFSHCHADYNAFTLFSQGRYFILPPGYARRDSRFQNTISINGANLLPDPSRNPRILACESQTNYSYVIGEAAETFPSYLTVRRYRRHMLMLSTDWLVLFDEIQIGSSETRQWNRFEWAVHSDPQVCHLRLSGREAIWESEGCRKVTLSILQPSSFAWERTIFSSLEGEDMLEGLRLSIPEWYTPDMRVLTVWKCTDGATAVERLEAEGGTALTIGGETPSWVVAFCHDVPRQAGSPIVSYRYSGPHHLLLFGLPVDSPRVGIQRDLGVVNVLPFGGLEVNTGGCLDVAVN